MTVIGPELFKVNAKQQLESSIGTLFPRHEIIITAPPLHAMQREEFKDWFSKAQVARGEPSPNEPKLSWEAGESVDLFFAIGARVIIRPELERLDLAFEADQMLQNKWGVSRHRISFMSVRDKRVRQALRERGELWRISALPSEEKEIGEAIAQSQVAIGAGRIYYYNPNSGTRFLTYAQFAQLAQLSDDALAGQLTEIARHCAHRNRHGNPEVAFFGVDPLRFGAPNFQGQDFQEMAAAQMRVRHAELVRQFHEATDPSLREDKPQWRPWQMHMFSAIAGEREQPCDTLQGIDAEFAPAIRWLPGGAFQDGEFHLAPIFPSQDGPPKDMELKTLWDPLARGFITNFIREHSDIEYLNLGRIGTARSDSQGGRHGVYLAEIKVKGAGQHQVLLLRVLRWGLRERLVETDESGRPKDFFRAVFETEEYIDYTLDRRLACLQFGMRLPSRVNMRRVTEPYTGSRFEFIGRFLPVIYFERDFLIGIPTNKIPERKLAEPRYAIKLAWLMGKAAAPNMIVGRSREPLTKETIGAPFFDDGNEIIIEGADGLPRELVVVDHSGAFAGWRPGTLVPFAAHYAEPINRRATCVPDPKAFAQAYLDSFAEEFRRLQLEYERQRGAFDGLFKHQPSNEQGNFAFRWNQVLQRLRESNLEELVGRMRMHITVFKQNVNSDKPGESPGI